ncbi:unnamed protein product [Rotaria sordida]|uniref:RING-type domain-containing protein n=1 Tax=Rotaria sordida TaxID=392033 RepID=A0A815J4G6_9BILA|nr:unnamed protein product [Rotaria sordida]
MTNQLSPLNREFIQKESPSMKRKECEGEAESGTKYGKNTKNDNIGNGKQNPAAKKIKLCTNEIDGLQVIRDFIDKEERKLLWSNICKENWSKEITRDTLHYGQRYDYKTRTLVNDVKEIPEWKYRESIKRRGMSDNLTRHPQERWTKERYEYLMCPLCHSPLDSCIQLHCCGMRVCETCIPIIKNGGFKCPLCYAFPVDGDPDKGFMRENKNIEHFKGTS